MREMEEEKSRSTVEWTINSIARARQKGEDSSAIQSWMSYERDLNQVQRGKINFTQEEAIQLEMRAGIRYLSSAETVHEVQRAIDQIQKVGFRNPTSIGFAGSRGYDLKLTMPQKLAVVGMTPKQFAMLCRKTYVRVGRVTVTQIKATWHIGSDEIKHHTEGLELASQQAKVSYEDFGTTRREINTMVRGACLVRARVLVAEIREKCHQQSVTDLVAHLLREVVTGRFPLSYLKVSPEEVARWLVSGQIAELEFGKLAEQLTLPSGVIDCLQKYK